MKLEKKQLLENVTVAYNSYKNTFDCRAEIRLDDYTVKIPTKSFHTIEEAVTDIKKRVIEAIARFYEMKKEAIKIFESRQEKKEI